jgi:spore coat polysaccharide biosynthesis protein SpsF
MGSARFPGKVLAPLAGRPVIAHVVERVAQVLSPSAITVLTSTERADDPLALYAGELGIDVYRGPRDDVLARFVGCLEDHPCDWLLRVSADSPLLDPALLNALLEVPRAGVDVVTNVFPRTYPKGQSAELVRAGALRALALRELTDEAREHVTQGFYENPDDWTIVNLTAPPGTDSEYGLAIDTLDDLRRLEVTCAG